MGPREASVKASRLIVRLLSSARLGDLKMTPHRSMAPHRGSRGSRAKPMISPACAALAGCARSLRARTCVQLRPDMRLGRGRPPDRTRRPVRVDSSLRHRGRARSLRRDVRVDQSTERQTRREAGAQSQGSLGDSPATEGAMIDDEPRSPSPSSSDAAARAAAGDVPDRSLSRRAGSECQRSRTRLGRRPPHNGGGTHGKRPVANAARAASEHARPMPPHAWRPRTLQSSATSWFGLRSKV